MPGPSVCPRRWGQSGLLKKYRGRLRTWSSVSSSFPTRHQPKDPLCVVLCQTGGGETLSKVRPFLLLFKYGLYLLMWSTSAHSQVLGFHKCNLLCGQLLVELWGRERSPGPPLLPSHRHHSVPVLRLTSMCIWLPKGCCYSDLHPELSNVIFICLLHVPT